MKAHACIAACVAVACLLYSGCSINATVSDFSQNRIDVRKLKLKPMRRKILIVHGGATRIIKLKNIDKIALYPHGSKSVGGQLYYQAEVTLDDGTKIGFSDPAKGKPADAFMCIDGELRGRTEDGKYRITLDNVSVIEIQD